MPPNRPPETAHGPTCLLINPRSFLAARNGLWRKALEVAEQHGAPVHVACEPGAFHAAMQAFSALNAARVIVLGGDGTLQGLLSACCQNGTLETLPPLMKLGGGRTNLIAANLKGTGRDVIGKLKRTLGAPSRPESVRTVPIFTVHTDDAAPEAGLFLAGATLDDIIRGLHKFRAGYECRWRDGGLATLWWLTRRTGLAVTGRQPLPAHEMAIDAGELGQIQGAMRLVMFSTLDYMGPGITPYARRGQGAVRLLALRSGARRFWLRLPAILRGRYTEKMNPQTGYLSGRHRSVQVSGLHRYCIDGQEFASASGIVEIKAGPTIRFEEPL